MLRKIVTDWHKLLFSFFRVIQGKGIGFQICGCFCEQMSPLASSGNGTGRPILAPGGWNNIPPRASEGGRRDGLNKWVLYEPAHPTPPAILFPSLQLSSKNICLLFLRHPPHTSVLASPWPILSIVVDVMTKNKQCEGVRRPLCVSRAFPLAAAERKDIPRRRQPLPPSAHSLWQVHEHPICGGSDAKCHHRSGF